MLDIETFNPCEITDQERGHITELQRGAEGSRIS